MNLLGLNKFSGSMQDTVCGFLMGGVGELDKTRRPNFLVVDKSKFLALIE